MPNNDAEAVKAERRRVIAEQFSKRPVEVVIGIVSADGVGGWQTGDQQWTLSFRFHCWKIPPHQIKSRPLYVSFTSNRKEFDSLWDRLKSHSIVRIQARVVEESITGVPDAQMVEFLGLDDTDSEMMQAAIEYQKPVTYQDSQFGEFVLNRRTDWFTTETEWNGQLVSLDLVLQDGKIDSALHAARSLWEQQLHWAKQVEDFAVQELLPLKNESWLDEDEVELSAEEFKARMKLESITVEPDGDFEFWHNDGDLFWGHSIQVRGNFSTGLIDADIPG